MKHKDLKTIVMDSLLNVVSRSVRDSVGNSAVISAHERVWNIAADVVMHFVWRSIRNSVGVSVLKLVKTKIYETKRL